MARGRVSKGRSLNPRNIRPSESLHTPLGELRMVVIFYRIYLPMSDDISKSLTRYDYDVKLSCY
jgi:hypothetical protein